MPASVSIYICLVLMLFIYMSVFGLETKMGVAKNLKSSTTTTSTTTTTNNNEHEL